jgi:amino acid transporter
MLGCLLPTGLLFVGGLYCLGTLSHARSLALDRTNAPFDVIAQSVGLPALGWLSSLGVALSCFGCALGGFNTGSRVLYSMARSRSFWRSMQAVHPANGTPYRAIAFLGLISLAAPTALILAGVHLEDAMGYLIQIASFGFLGAYSVVCVAAPVYLARRGRLRTGSALAALVATAAIGATWILSFYPAPDPPWRYLPAVFFGLLGAGLAASLLARGPRTRSKAREHDPKSQLVGSRSG